MAESMEIPDEIQLDVVRNGEARLLVSWDIQEVTVDTQTRYQYQQAVTMKKIPYASLASRETVLAYITANAAEIIDDAKASTVTIL